MTVPEPSQSATPLPQHQFGLQLADLSRYLGARRAATSRYPATDGVAPVAAVAATGLGAVAAPDSAECLKNQLGSGVAAQRADSEPLAKDTAATDDPEPF